MTNQLLDKINAKLSTKPLVYFCREAERAIGLEHLLENYHICCIEDNNIVDELITRGFSVFCLERILGKSVDKSTTKLISQPETIDWIKKISKSGEFYSQSFFPSDVLDFKLKNLGATTLGNPYKFYLEFENKLKASLFFEKNNISIAPNFLDILGKLTFVEVQNKLGNKFVIQLEKSHTGAGTFIIESEIEFLAIVEQYKGNQVKFSKFIEGDTYTINACICEEQIFIGPLQYQITGINELTTGKGSTVGNDFSKGAEIIKNSLNLKNKLIKEINHVAEKLRIDGYRGLFGIDLIIADDTLYILEINARQTANIPLQTKLELFHSIANPLQLINLATLLNIDFDNSEYDNLSEISGGQIFLRALGDNTTVAIEPKSGVYRLQSDNSAVLDIETGEKKDNTILIDEDGDKPLIFKSNGYSILDLKNNSGFIINFQRAGQTKNEFEELVRMQFSEGIILNNTVKPWILETLVSLREKITKNIN